MRLVRKLSFLLLAFSCATCFEISAVADEIQECKPIRRPGLESADVDRIALGVVAKAVGVAPQSLRLEKSMKENDHAGRDIMAYAVFVVGVSDELGIDFATASTQSSGRGDSVEMFSHVPITELLTITKRVYFQQPDSPFPSATPGARYHGFQFEVATPDPPTDWMLVRCASDQIVFIRRTPSEFELKASVSGISLKPFKDKEQFLAEVQDALVKGSLAPRTGQSVQVRMVEGTGAPCATAEVIGQATSLAQDALFARFCYSPRVPHLGYAAILAHSRSTDLESDRILAQRFFSGVKPYDREKPKGKQ